MSILKHQLRQPIIIFLIALVAITTLAAIFQAPINRQMHRWKLLPEPERLTELYFTSPNTLPATYIPGQTQTVAFTVHNLEYRTVTYHYKVEQTTESPNQKLPLASGSFTLTQNGYAYPTPQIILGDLDRSKVNVTITPTNENIGYWIKRG